MRAVAVVLDLNHRCLLTGGHLPTIDVGAGERPLAALLEAAPRTLGLTLPPPSGRHGAGDEAWFLFLVAGATPATRGEHTWVPLRSWANEAALAAAWTLYVDAMLGGWQPPTRALEVGRFGSDPEMAARLAHLIVKGKKRGTTGWVLAAERDGWEVPHVGTVALVTDGFGIPLCAIETERIERCRFGDSGAEIARAEGEGDGSFDDWHAEHRRYFEAEGARLGAPFDDDSLVFHEYFRVLHVLGQHD